MCIRRIVLARLAACILAGLFQAAPCAAAILSWTNTAGGAFSTAANWNPAVVPSDTDVCNINVSGTYTVTMGSVSVAGINLGTKGTGTRTLSVNSGTKCVVTDLSVGAASVLSLNGGSLSTALSELGVMQISAGVVSLSGSITTGAATHINLAAGTTLKCNGFVNQGTIDLTGSPTTPTRLTTISGTLINNPAGVIHAGPDSCFISAPLHNRGVMNLGGVVELQKAGAVDSSTGRIHIYSGTFILDTDGGSFTQTDSIVGTSLVVQNATGTFNQNGIVNLSGSGSWNGGILNHSINFVGNGAETYTGCTINLNADLHNVGLPTGPVFDGCTLNGPALWQTSGPTSDVTIRNCVINCNLDLTVPGHFQGFNQMNGSLQQQHSFAIESSNAYGDATLAYGSDLTVATLIQFTCTSGGHNSILDLGSHTLTIPASQSITGSNPATLRLKCSINNSGIISSGNTTAILGRTGAAVVNSGTLHAPSGSAIFINCGGGSFTNSGPLKVDAAAGFCAVDSASVVLATLPSGPGLLSLAYCTWNPAAGVSNTSFGIELLHSTVGGTGSLTCSATKRMTILGSTLNLPLINQGIVTVQDSCVFNGGLTTVAGSRLMIFTPTTLSPANLTVTTPFTNHGAIDFRTAVLDGECYLGVPNGYLTNAPGDSILALGSPDGLFILRAAIDNQGVIYSETGFSIDRQGPAYLNSGKIVSAGGGLNIHNPNGSFTNSGMILSGFGTIDLTGMTYSEVSGGTVNPSDHVDFDSCNVYLSQDINVAGGSIGLSYCTVHGPGRFLSQPAGYMSISNSTVDTPIYAGQVLDIYDSAYVNDSLITPPGSTISMYASALGDCRLFLGKSMLLNGTLQLAGANAATHAAVEFTGSSDTLTISPTGKLQSSVQGTGLRLINGSVINIGTLSAGYPLTLARSQGFLQNAGSVLITAGALNVNYPGGSFINSGTISLSAGTTLNMAAGVLLQQSSGRLQGNGTVELNGAALTNAGLILPGSSPGTLTIHGKLLERGTAAILLDLQGTSQGASYDHLVVSDTVTLLGSVGVHLPCGYVPNPGDAYHVLDFAARVGSPQYGGLHVGNGLNLVPTLGSTSLVLQATGALSDNADVAVNDVATVSPNKARTLFPLINDTDPNGDILRITSLDSTFTVGHLALNPDSLSVTYVPPAGQTSFNDYFQYRASDCLNASDTATVHVVVSAGAGVDSTEVAGRSLRLALAGPNPFRFGTSIRFELPAPGRLELELFNPLGRRVRVLESAEFAAGSYAARWDGRGPDGRAVASGVYFARLTLRSATGSAVRALRLVRME